MICGVTWYVCCLLGLLFDFSYLMLNVVLLQCVSVLLLAGPVYPPSSNTCHLRENDDDALPLRMSASGCLR